MSLIIALLFTAYVWVALLITLPPLWATLALMPTGPAADRLVRRWSRVIVRMTLCRLKVSGAEHLSTGVPGMLVSNHQSYFDAVVLMAAIPADFRFVSFHGVLTWPVVGTAIRRAGHLTVDRSSREARLACARAMRDTLERGRSLLVFPEGRMNAAPDLLPFHLGAFRAAVDTGRPVVPITLGGTDVMFPVGSTLIHPSRLTVVIHQPIEPLEKTRSEMTRLRAEARRRMTARGAGDGVPRDQYVRRATHSRSSESTTT